MIDLKIVILIWTKVFELIYLNILKVFEHLADVQID